MGMYLNPGYEAFKSSLDSEIYVDKSMLIDILNGLCGTMDKFLCVSRPRRFGKSVAGNMISAYYSKGCDSRELFAGLKISEAASFGSKLNKYNVIKFDLNGFYQNLRRGQRLIGAIETAIREEFVAQFPDLEFKRGATLPDCIMAVYAATGQQFVVIIDEYDVLIRERAPKKVFDSYLSFLSGLFKNSTLRPAFALAYLTGIFPIVRDRIQSKMNEFREYSMLGARKLAPFTGFTADETIVLCEKYNIDYAECRRWYDGYNLQGTEIFNPKSVIEAMDSGRCGNYWTTTGTYESIKEYIDCDFDGIRGDILTMLSGGNVAVNVARFMNTMTDIRNKDDVFTCLIHLGYLAYNQGDGTCRIPNSEIRSEWLLAVEDSKKFEDVLGFIRSSRDLLDSTVAGDAEAVAATLGKIHQTLAANIYYNRESVLQCVIGLAYFYANTRYTVVKELPAGKGFADLALIPFEPGLPAVIMELKVDKTPAAAIRQIKERHYADALGSFRGEVLLVGVSYDKETKEHRCAMERMTK